MRLDVNQAATLDFNLSLAQTTTTVEVSDEAPVLQSETSNVGTTFKEKLIESYPLVERSAARFTSWDLVRYFAEMVKAAGGRCVCQRGGGGCRRRRTAM